MCTYLFYEIDIFRTKHELWGLSEPVIVVVRNKLLELIIKFELERPTNLSSIMEP